MTAPSITARQLTHPAILRSQEVYNARGEDNRLRDLTDAEAVFVAAVHLAGTRRTETVGFAISNFGYGSEAHSAAVRLADRQEKAELSLALEIFEASVEAEELGSYHFDCTC